MMPAIRRNRVDFPAPLGRSAPRISPCSTSRSTWFTATRPPKRLVRSRQARIGSAIAHRKNLGRRLFPAAQAIDDPEDAARFEYHDRDQQQAEREQVDVGERRGQLPRE